MADLLIKHAFIITMDSHNRLIEDGAVKIEKDRITDIGLTKDLQDRYAGSTVIGASGRAVMPGLVNAHSHLSMIFGRTLGYDNGLTAWLKVQKSLVSAFTLEDWELAEALGCVENIKNGNTCVNDMNSATHAAYQESVDDVCARAFEKTGIRAILSRGYLDDQNYFQGYAETRKEIIDRLERLIGDWHGAANNRITIQLAPTIPWGCSPELLRETRRLADKHGIGIHHHASETPGYNDLVRQRFGYPTNIEYLEDVGNLGRDVQLSHAVWLTDSDLNRIAETGTHVVHNPTSNMILASGISRVPEMLKLGINVGLGCDGPACNNNQDSISNMKFASLLQKVNSLNPTALTAQDVLKMSTINGSNALGLGNVGPLEPGRKADLITIDLTRAHMVPVLDVIGAIVYSANGGDVNDVIVDGELIMKDRKILTVDEDDIKKRAQKAAEKCLRRCGSVGL